MWAKFGLIYEGLDHFKSIHKKVNQFMFFEAPYHEILIMFRAILK
jgi:hypothetical protein